MVSFVLRQKKALGQEVVVHLVGKRKISQLHGMFFDDPSPTDCISFPFHDPEFLGEIFICPQVAKEYNPKKPYEETSLYIIHAILHLLGYEDKEEKNRKIMHREQAMLLKLALENRCILET